jgi:hypothetical protein
MKKEAKIFFVLFLVLIIISLSAVSASIFSNSWNKMKGLITGKAITTGGWTQWFDRDNPGGSGDYELLNNIRSVYPDVCENPMAVECRTTWTNEDFSKTGEVVTCSKESGFSCVNANQPDGICNYDYEVRFYCGTLETCTNECSYSGQKFCDGNYLKTCGNYDADSCLEWSSSYCSYGCENNVL